MAGPFDRAIATAQRLIARYGEDCLWQQPAETVETSPGYSDAGPTPDPIPVRIAWFSSRDLGRGTSEFLALLAGKEVPAGQEIGLMAGGLSFTPSDKDKVIRTETEVSVKSLDRLAPNGTPVLYYVTVSE